MPGGDGEEGGEEAAGGHATVDTLSATLEAPPGGSRGARVLSLRLPRPRRLTLHVLWSPPLHGAAVRVTDARGQATLVACAAERDFVGRPVASCELPLLLGRVRLDWTTLVAASGSTP